MKKLIIFLTFLHLMACSKDRYYKAYTFYQEVKVVKGFYIGCIATIKNDGGPKNNGVYADIDCPIKDGNIRNFDVIVGKDDLE
jgi:hypothetical protein